MTKDTMLSILASILFFGGVFIGTIGLYAPMNELQSPGGTPLFRMMMELTGIANMIAGLVFVLVPRR